ncbi:MAG: methyltransferase [Phycisphaerales bacterium]
MLGMKNDTPRMPAEMMLMQLASGYWGSAALGAAVQCGLFDALKDGPLDAASIAARQQTDVRLTAALADALAGLGLLVVFSPSPSGGGLGRGELEPSGDMERRQDSTSPHPGPLPGGEGGRLYAIAPAFAELLVPGGAKDMLPALRFNLDLYPLWGRLSEAVKSGKPVVPPGAHLGDDAERTRRFVEGMHSRALALGPMILAGVDVSDRKRLLDVGAGPGTFGRQLAAAHAGLHVTLLDLPGVIAVAKRLSAGHVAEGRIGYVEADYRGEDWGTRGGEPGAALEDSLCPGLEDRDSFRGRSRLCGFDAVLYCGALHQESDASAGALMQKLHGVLERGGKLFVVDLMFEDDGVTPAFAGLFALNMMLFNPRARVFTAGDVERLLRVAGFTDVKTSRVPRAGYATVTGIKS